MKCTATRIENDGRPYDCHGTMEKLTEFMTENGNKVVLMWCPVCEFTRHINPWKGSGL